MTRGNSLLECPKCVENTLEVVASDVDEQNIGLRRYQCKECRNRFTTVETFFTDLSGDEDPFLNLALNYRLAERAAHYRRTGTKPRRQLKPTDSLVLETDNGTITIRYKRSWRDGRLVFLVCKRGHSLEDKTNVYVNPRTRVRTCKKCRAINQARFNAKPETKARRRAKWAANAERINAQRRKRPSNQEEQQAA